MKLYELKKIIESDSECFLINVIRRPFFITPPLKMENIKAVNSVGICKPDELDNRKILDSTGILLLFNFFSSSGVA